MDEHATVYDIQLFICYLLRKLKLILLAALAGALLLGGFQAGTAWIAQRESQENLTINRKRIAELEDNHAFNERLLADYQHYIDNSLYQHLDPAAITRTSLFSYIRFVPAPGTITPELQDPDYVTRNEAVILNAWRLVGLTDPVVAALDQLLGQSHERKYYDEIITVDVLANANLVRVTTLYDQPDLSRRIAETVMEALHADLNERILPHTVSPIRSNSDTAANPDMRTVQTDMIGKIDKLTIEQRSIIRQIDALKNPGGENPFSWANVFQYAGFGAIIGLALMLLILFFLDAVSLRLDQEKSLQARYRLPVLGRLQASSDPDKNKQQKPKK